MLVIPRRPTVWPLAVITTLVILSSPNILCISSVVLLVHLLILYKHYWGIFTSPCRPYPTVVSHTVMYRTSHRSRSRPPTTTTPSLHHALCTMTCLKTGDPNNTTTAQVRSSLQDIGTHHSCSVTSPASAAVRVVTSTAPLLSKNGRENLYAPPTFVWSYHCQPTKRSSLFAPD